MTRVNHPSSTHPLGCKGGLPYGQEAKLNHTHTSQCMTKKKRFYGEKALEDITQVVCNYSLLLDDLGSDNVTNARRVINTFRDNISELHSQNTALIKALECDNWKNAVARANKLMTKDKSFNPPPTLYQGSTVGAE